GDLLVGNFGDSHVNVFNLKTGIFLGQLEDPNGQPLVLLGGFQGPSSKGLWGLGFGNGEGGAGQRTLFFASGINDESDGLFGMVTTARGKPNGENDGMLVKVNGDPTGRDPAPATSLSSSAGVQSFMVVPSPVINGSGLN